LLFIGFISLITPVTLYFSGMLHENNSNSIIRTLFIGVGKREKMNLPF